MSELKVNTEGGIDCQIQVSSKFDEIGNYVIKITEPRPDESYVTEIRMTYGAVGELYKKIYGALKEYEGRQI